MIIKNVTSESCLNLIQVYEAALVKNTPLNYITLWHQLVRKVSIKRNMTDSTKRTPYKIRYSKISAKKYFSNCVIK